jgi:hypothetical protein
MLAISDVFISYTRVEQPIAQKLHDALVNEGWEVDVGRTSLAPNRLTVRVYLASIKWARMQHRPHVISPLAQQLATICV